MKFPGALGLRWKTILLMTLGLLMIFVVLRYISDRTFTHSIDAALQERLLQAEAIATLVDTEVGQVLVQISHVSRLPGLKGGFEEQRETIRNAFDVMGSVRTLSLLDAQGRTLWEEPWTVPSGHDQAGYRALAVEALQAGGPVAAQVSTEGSFQGVIAIVAAPVPGQGGEPLSVVIGEVDITRKDSELTPLPKFTSTSKVSVIDEKGDILVGTPEDEDPFYSEHISLLGPLIRDRLSGVRLHHSNGAGDHVVAFVPFRATAGGILFEEHNDLVLAIAQRLRRTLVVLGLAATGLASVAAWLYVRNVVQPLLALRRAADRIARGNLEEPVEVNRKDELGDLGRAFESMRLGLLDSQSFRLKWEQELEDRVKAQGIQLRQLFGRVISTQEAERQRIARELHDGAAQMLTALLLQVEGMACALPADSPAAETMAPAAREYARQALEEMRRVILDLRPPALDDLGLVAALREYARQKLSESDILMDFEIVRGPVHLDSSLEIAVFRIIQEAINNVANHSNAAHAAIVLECGPDVFRATVKDDGKGFILQNVIRSTPGVGIMGMLERAEIIGGHLSVLSEPGAGTQVSLEVPIDGEYGNNSSHESPHCR